MRTFPDVRMRSYVADSNRVSELLDGGQHADAKALALDLRERARKIGLESGYVSWALAVACDYLGELEMAFTTIVEAVRLDPLNPACQRSFELIAHHLRTALADPERAAGDPSTPRLYDLLVGAGEADVPSHLAMARWLAHGGRTGDALRLLDAVTLLAPISRDAWEAKAAIARAAGDAELGARCDAEAAAIGLAPLPFGIPAPRGTVC